MYIEVDALKILRRSELGDCSWFHSCRTPSGRLSTRFKGFSTVQVRSLELGEQ